MTKFEVRMVTLGMLEIESGDTFLDIGAGSGSVSVEAALQGAAVYAIEKEAEGVWLIRANAERFGAVLNIIQEAAPEGMHSVPHFNKCFIGGSGGQLKSIFEAVHQRIDAGGIVAANFVTLRNLQVFQQLLKAYHYENTETKLIQVSAADHETGIMKAQNPVFIVKGVKH